MMSRITAAWRSGPLGVRNFRLLMAGQFASTIGDYCYAIALPWYVLTAHGSTILLGTVLACYGIPRTVLIPLGGVLADKLGPRPVMLMADGARCALVAALTVLATRHTVSLETLGPLAAAIGAGEGLFIPPSFSIMPSLIGSDQLAAGNAIFQAGQQGGSLLGPAIGGALVALAGPAPAFGVDAASFAISALTLALLPRRTRQPADNAGAAEGTGGSLMSLLRTSQALKILVLIVLAANLASGGLSDVALPTLAHHRFGASGFGALLACLAAGSIAGTLAGLRGGSIRKPVPFISVVYLAMCAGMALVPFLGGLAGAAAAMFVFGAGNGLGNVIVLTRLQLWAPPGLIGRVMSLIMLCAYGSFPLSVAVTGILIGHIGPAAFFPIAAGLVVVTILFGLTQPGWRTWGVQAPEPGPEPGPGPDALDVTSSTLLRAGCHIEHAQAALGVRR
jgi:predicted MFS family arabinose efflux permease